VSGDARPVGDGGAEYAGLTPEQLAHEIAAQASDKKAIDIVVLDLRPTAAGFADFFVICSGGTERQTKAIHDGIHQGLKERFRLLPRRVEGTREARWILMDYLDVVVHVFTPETRAYYRLEQLWGEVPARAFETEEVTG
jgi:ribosome-associated protein